MHLHTLADPELIFPDLPAFDVPTVLRAFADRIASAGRLGGDADSLYRALWEREQLGSTGIGQGVAVPHCKLGGIDEVLLAIGHVEKPIDFAAVDDRPVRLFFVVVSPESSPAAHLQGLAAISRWVQENPDGIETILSLSDPAEIYRELRPGASREST